MKKSRLEWLKYIEDKSLIIYDNIYNKPYYYFILLFYEEICDDNINKIIRLLISSYSKFKLKAGSFFTVIDKTENPKSHFQNNYLANDFKIIVKDNYETKFIRKKNDSDNERRYDELIMYIRNIGHMQTALNKR